VSLLHIAHVITTVITVNYAYAQLTINQTLTLIIIVLINITAYLTV